MIILDKVEYQYHIITQHTVSYMKKYKNNHLNQNKD